MKCPKCGAENPEHVTYCGHCGESVREWPKEVALENEQEHTPRSSAKKEIEWTPLLIVIGAAYLTSMSMYLLSVPSSIFELEFDLSIILSFLVSTSLIVTIALVIYRKEDLAKKSLIIGMGLLICGLALRTSVYLRIG